MKKKTKFYCLGFPLMCANRHNIRKGQHSKKIKDNNNHLLKIKNQLANLTYESQKIMIKLIKLKETCSMSNKT